MMWFLFPISLPCVLLVGIIMRLCPYWKDLSLRQKKQLLFGYSIVFVLGMLMISLATPYAVTLTAYKLGITFGALGTFFVDCLVLRKEFYARLFILSMQVSITFCLHSIPAFFIGRYFGDTVTLSLLMLQSYLMVGLSIVLAYPLYKLFRRPFIAFRWLTFNDYYWKVIWLVPALMYGAVFFLTLNPAWIDFRGLLARIMVAIAVYVIFRCITLDYQEYQQRDQIASNNRLLTSQTQAMADSIKILEESEEKFHRIRHDFRHQLRTLVALQESGDLHAIQEALASMNASLEETIPLRFCDNSILNAAILFYNSDAKNKDITCDIAVEFPEDLGVDALQLAVVLSNGLENAIQACVGQNEKLIILRSRCSQGKIALDIRNRFDGIVYFDNEGVPISQREHHGTGTRSILAFTNKHNGMCTFSHEDGWFVLRVMVENIIIS